MGQYQTSGYIVAFKMGNLTSLTNVDNILNIPDASESIMQMIEITTGYAESASSISLNTFDTITFTVTDASLATEVVADVEYIIDSSSSWESTISAVNTSQTITGKVEIINL